MCGPLIKTSIDSRHICHRLQHKSSQDEILQHPDMGSDTRVAFTNCIERFSL